MRPLALLTPAALLLLAACAAGPNSSYAADLDRLRADCTARNGVLTPTGSSTGHVETEYVCRINGPATRLQN